MAANSKKNGKKTSDKTAAEGLSFMKPIEPREAAEAPADDEPKLSRAERRAAKPQAKTYGKAPSMRSQATPSHRNFTSRRSGG